MFDERALAALLEQIIVEPFQLRSPRLATQSMPAARSPKLPSERERIRLHSMTQAWRSRGGVRGFGIGEKIVGAKRTGDLAIRIYVDRKKPVAGLSDPVPPSLELPDFGVVPTDVVEIGRVVAQMDTARYRPAMPGSSIGHVSTTAGTFGCLVRRRGDPGRTFILSNAHVLAVNGAGYGNTGDAVVQPGPLDGGIGGHDTIATLAEAIPIDFGGMNAVDAAIAEVADAADVTTLTARGPVAAGRIVRSPRRGTLVRKFGRTSDYSVAEILDVHATLDIEYETPHGRRSATFFNQVLLTKCSDSGDSGSLVTTLSGRPVGLLFAGSESNTVINRIHDVLSALDVEIVQ